MARSVELHKLTGISGRFGAFVAERHPLALADALEAFEAASRHADSPRPSAISMRCGRRFGRSLPAGCPHAPSRPPDLARLRPARSAEDRLEQAHRDVVDACDGFLRRAAIEASLTRRRTARDPARHGAHARHRQSSSRRSSRAARCGTATRRFRAKDFDRSARRRSTRRRSGCAAARRIAAPTAHGGRRRRADDPGSGRGAGHAPRAGDGADGPERADGQGRPAVRGQGSAHRAISPGASCRPRRRSAIATLTIAGMAMAFAREGVGRVARVVHRRGRLVARRVARGDQSLRRRGACRRSSASRTIRRRCRRRSRDQSAVRVFADKAAGYGIPGITLDGTDPDAIAAAFAWAAERARAGAGPDADRARVDADVRPRPPRRHAVSRPRSAAVLGVPAARREQGYVDRELYEYWSARDPIATYAARLEAEGVVEAGESSDSNARRRRSSKSEAQAIVDAPWPEPRTAGAGVFAGEAAARARGGAGSRRSALKADARTGPSAAARIRDRRRSIRRGRTFLEAVMLGVGDALRADPRVFVLRSRTSAASTATRSCCCGRC